MLIPVILSGGSGTRLWPLSTPGLPKQFLPLISERTLFQDTLLRLEGLPDIADPIIVCNEAHRDLVAGQLRAIGANASAIVLEPEGRNTAPAVGVAAVLASTPGLPGSVSDAVLLVLPADHVIADAAAFRSAVIRATAVARAGHLVTFGIVPTHAETGYGYIEQGAELPGGRAVARFVEKPARSAAEIYIASGRYLWNSGMFVLPAQAFLAELALHAPDIHRACERSAAATRSDDGSIRLGPDFLACPADSIDYAVLEKTDRAAVVPLDAGWSDIGSWAALHAALAPDRDGNVSRGRVTTLDSRDNLVVAGSRRVALLGVESLVVIDAGDAILVASKSRSQDLKELLKRLGPDAAESEKQPLET